MRKDQIALQLFTVRDLVRADLDAALRIVASAGYDAVELAGVSHVPTDTLRRAIDEAGLRVVGSHQPIEGLRADPDGIAARLLALGCDRAIVPTTPPADRATAADVRRLAGELGGLATRFADAGIRVGYHNHDFEFAALDGTTMWDVLLDGLPPAVEIELDAYWVSVGGRDPVTEIAAVAGRLHLLHLKDRAPGAEPRDAVPGEGILPIAAIVEAGRAAGVEWYIAELVDAADPAAAIAATARYLEARAG